MKTFKELQDEVLDWMADGSNTGHLRDMVKLTINRSHSRLLTRQQWDFMLWPRTETISVTSGEKFYALHPLFHTPLYFYNPTTDEYLEEVPQRQLMESEEDWQDGELAEPERFSLSTLANVQTQPSADGTVTVTTTAGTESSSNSVVITGITGGGIFLEETLSSGSAWSSLTSNAVFGKVLNVTKVGTTWTRTITVTGGGSTTLLSLLSTEFGKQFRQFELLAEPTAAATIQYRFFQKPLQLTRDNEIPQLPEEFSELLVWDALLKLQGYVRSTGEELLIFKANYEEQLADMRATYLTSRSLGARPKYVHYIPRV